MGIKSTSIFHGEEDQDVGAAVRRRNGVARDAVRQELSVLRLIRCVARDRVHLLQHYVHVHCCHDRVYDQVLALREKVEIHYIVWLGAVCRS